MLTLDNYFSPESDKEYLSVSQFKAFKKCEFSAYHQYVTHEYKRPVTDALLIGSYVDAYFAGTFDEWKEKHPEIYGKSNKLKSPFVNADIMIARIERDRLFMSCMTGLKQQVLIADINGVKWKCLPDFINTEACIGYDLKTTRSFEAIWSDIHKRKVPFYEAYNYFLQLAIYQEAIEQKYEYGFVMAICAVTKEKTPDIKIIEFSDQDCTDRMYQEIESVKEYQPFILKIKAGEVDEKDLRRCEQCDHCKNTKVLESFEDAIAI